MSNVIAHILLTKCVEYFFSYYLQSGFRQDHSTDLCLFAFKEIINYYVSNGDQVFACFVDASMQSMQILSMQSVIDIL